jgi:membrane associated rhomboid family serine protease
MGFSDRPYGQQPPFGFSPSRGGGGSGFARVKMWSFSTWIIAINVAVFLIDAILVKGGGKPYLALLGYFSADTAIQGGQVWRFLTFQFLHAGLGHLLMNMLGIYFFGPLIERHFGSKRFLAFYLLCGVAGPIAYMLLWASGLLVTTASVPLVGASAGVFGILIAAAVIAPDAMVYVMMIFPVKLRHLAILLIFIAAYTVIFFGHKPGENAGGEAAHLGGAALGYLFIRRPYLLNWADRLSVGSVKDRVADKVEQSKTQRNQKLQMEVDRILRKVHDQGIAALTEKEKRTLAEATERQRKN